MHQGIKDSPVLCKRLHHLFSLRDIFDDGQDTGNRPLVVMQRRGEKMDINLPAVFRHALQLNTTDRFPRTDPLFDSLVFQSFFRGGVGDGFSNDLGFGPSEQLLGGDVPPSDYSIGTKCGNSERRCGNQTGKKIVGLYELPLIIAEFLVILFKFLCSCGKLCIGGVKFVISS